MRKFSLPLALVVVLAATVALAAKPEVRSFTPLTAQGVSGEARLNDMPQQSSTRIQVHLDNLAPNTEYIGTISLAGSIDCTGGVAFVTFQSNKQGKAVVNELVPQQVVDIGPIGIAPSSSPLALEACAQ
ncbi:MAG TPA: hypothetical protein VFE28_00410 [Candidatus Krumholzibacteria bacterium]|nr:hypothetical protein [Candidatus Krumholzibacteria bacterium]